MSTRQLRKLALAVGFCAVGASLAGAPAAWAVPGDDATLVVEHRTVPSGGDLGMLVGCGGRRAVGGGVGFVESSGSYTLQSGPTDATGQFFFTDDGSVPVSWYSAVHNGTASAQNYAFYANCSANSDATVQAESFQLTFSSGGGGADVPALGGKGAACPAAERAIGGGLLSDAGTSPASFTGSIGPLDETGQVSATDSGDVASSWYASAFLSGQDGTVRYKTLAICSAGSTSTLAVARVAGGALESRSPSCPTGFHALSGGAEGEDSIADLTVFTGPSSASDAQPVSGTAAQGWYTASVPASSPFYPNPTARRFYAVCQSEPAAGSPPAPPSASPAGRRCKHRKKHARAAKKKCHRKKRRGSR